MFRPGNWTETFRQFIAFFFPFSRCCVRSLICSCNCLPNCQSRSEMRRVMVEIATGDRVSIWRKNNEFRFPTNNPSDDFGLEIGGSRIILMSRAAIRSFLLLYLGREAARDISGFSPKPLVKPRQPSFSLYPHASPPPLSLFSRCFSFIRSFNRSRHVTRRGN